MKLTLLKAAAYDILAQIQQLQENLGRINKAIEAEIKNPEDDGIAKTTAKIEKHIEETPEPDGTLS